MIKSAEGEQVRHLTMDRNKTNAIGDGLRVWRRRSPATRRLLFSTTLSPHRHFDLAADDAVMKYSHDRSA